MVVKSANVRDEFTNEDNAKRRIIGDITMKVSRYENMPIYEGKGTIGQAVDEMLLGFYSKADYGTVISEVTVSFEDQDAKAQAEFYATEAHKNK